MNFEELRGKLYTQNKTRAIANLGEYAGAKTGFYDYAFVLMEMITASAEPRAG